MGLRSSRHMHTYTHTDIYTQLTFIVVVSFSLTFYFSVSFSSLLLCLFGFKVTWKTRPSTLKSTKIQEETQGRIKGIKELTVHTKR